MECFEALRHMSLSNIGLSTMGTWISESIMESQKLGLGLGGTIEDRNPELGNACPLKAATQRSLGLEHPAAEGSCTCVT